MVEPSLRQRDGEDIGLEQSQIRVRAIVQAVGIDRARVVEGVDRGSSPTEHFSEAASTGTRLEDALAVQLARPAARLVEALFRDRLADRAVELCAAVAVPLQAE